MKIEHGEWNIESVPERKNHLWHAWIEVERGPWEDEDHGQIFNFSDIGCFDTEAAAHARGLEWGKAWLDSNF